jgi:predicted ATPase/class 3 adenylate cyclase
VEVSPSLSELPEGILTFLLTDVEASTRRWEQEPDAMRLALVRHDALFDAVVARHGGVVVKPRGEGDSRFVVFRSASAAVVAAAECQSCFFSESWPTSGPLRVRMALHTGESDLRDGDYYGSAVNRAARLRSLAHGGQVLISLSTVQLVRESLPAGVALRDLGQHRLKDLTEPEQVFQVAVTGVESDFPPLRSTDAPFVNLPVEDTPFIGRDRDIELVRNRLLDPDVRLVTLTGPGGSGKTRLALQVAARLSDAFEDGVHFVPLASIRETYLLVPAIARSIGVRESGGSTLAEVLREHLRQKSALLVLDNFEQVVRGAGQVADLLSGAPRLKVLVTSREALRLQAEREMLVQPLDLPGPGDDLSLDRLMRCESVRLFVERARNVKPDFALTPKNAAAVVEICRRLDGLPLAIELAAARIRLFSPQALLNRLERRLPILTHGPRDVPDRQRTLRDTIAWSYNLLDESEQVLFRRLAVFSGSFTIEAAEAILSHPFAERDSGSSRQGALEPELVLEGLDALVSKSLLRGVDSGSDEPRFGMLETIREFAEEMLDASGETALLRQSHTHVYTMLVDAYQTWRTASTPSVALSAELPRAAAEQGNIRAALRWSLDHDPDGTGLKLISGLWLLWFTVGQYAEGLEWSQQMVARSSRPETAAFAESRFAEGLFHYVQGNPEHAMPCIEDALVRADSLGDDITAGLSALYLANIARSRGDVDVATGQYDDSVERFERAGFRAGVQVARADQALFALMTHDFERASTLAEQVVAEAGSSNIWATQGALYVLTELALGAGQSGQALALISSSIEISEMIDDQAGLVDLMAQLARVAASEQEWYLCAVIAAAADRRRRALAYEPRGRSWTASQEALVIAQAHLSSDALEAASAEAATMTPGSALQRVAAVASG